MQDENVKVTCAPVPHPMVEPAYAYRLDTADRSIVISGDTAYSENWRIFVEGLDWDGNQQVSEGQVIYVLAEQGEFSAAFRVSS